MTNTSNRPLDLATGKEKQKKVKTKLVEYFRYVVNMGLTLQCINIF